MKLYAKELEGKRITGIHSVTAMNISVMPPNEYGNMVVGYHDVHNTPTDRYFLSLERAKKIGIDKIEQEAIAYFDNHTKET